METRPDLPRRLRRSLLGGGAALLVALALAPADARGTAEPQVAEEVRAEEGRSERASTVTHVRLEGELDAGALGLLERALDHARGSGHGRVVVELDTPGGQVDRMWKLARLLMDVDGEQVTVAWVHRNAISAGVMLALACDRIYMDPAGVIGASTPVPAVPVAPPPGVPGLPGAPNDPASPPQGVSEDVRNKWVSSLSAQFRATAESAGRPGLVAAAMVDPDLAVHQVRVDGAPRLISGTEWADANLAGDPPEHLRTIVKEGQLLTLTASEAVELGFADGLAESLEEVLEKVGAAGATVDRLERTRSEDLTAFLDSISGLLLVGGLLLGYMELKAPGFGLPGILALACFVLLLTGRWLAGLADVPHIVAVGLGVALVFAELFVFGGTIWLGLLGGLLVVGGLVTANLGPGFALGNPIDREILSSTLVELSITMLVALVGAWALSRYLPDTPVLRRLVLAPDPEPSEGEALPETRGRHAERARPGAEGVALTDLHPVGKVALGDDRVLEYEARADGALLERGSRVRVLEVIGGRLVVERAPAAEDAAAENGPRPGGAPVGRQEGA